MEKRPFSGRLWPDWGNTAWAAMAGLGSIGLTCGFLYRHQKVKKKTLPCVMCVYELYVCVCQLSACELILVCVCMCVGPYVSIMCVCLHGCACVCVCMCVCVCVAHSRLSVALCVYYCWPLITFFILQ